MPDKWRQWAQALFRETLALHLAMRDPRTPRYARLWAAVVVAYAVSPIDLIPDPIPVLGYLDDLLLIPVGIWIAVRLIPEEVLAEARAQAAEQEGVLPSSRAVTVAVVVTWFLFAALVVVMLVQAVR